MASDGTTLKTKVANFLDSFSAEEIESMNVKAVRRGITERYKVVLTTKDKADIQDYIVDYFKKQANEVAKKEEEAAAIAALASVSKPTTKKRKATKAAETDETTAKATTTQKKSAREGEPTCWVRTPGGVEAPRFLKKLQNSAMKTSTFLKNAG